MECYVRERGVATEIYMMENGGNTRDLEAG